MTSILVTGAAGRTGRAVLSAVAAAGHQGRAFIRDPGKESAVRTAGATEVAVGDLMDADSLVPATAGTDVVVHIGPPMDPDEVEMTGNVLSAALEHGADFVYYSVMHPLRREVRHHRLKLDAEEAVVESGLPYTILQPGRYMQHVTPQWNRVRDEGLLGFPFRTDAKFNVVDLEDLAVAVALVAGDPTHRYATYELAGPEPLSTEDMAAVCGEVLGRDVAAVRVPAADMVAAAQAAGASTDRVEQMRIMNAHYDTHGFLGNPHVLEWLLGRPATRFREYVQRLPA
jgi:uncharacterized protein YbjT (DUF2867 family)